MKTPEDIINRFINEENVKFNQERDDWMIEAMEEYAKLYHENEVKKLNIPAVSGRSEQLPCGDCENYAQWDNGIRWCSVCGTKLS